jgi:protein phosphatase
MTVIRHAALCDKGVQRKRNEDRYYIHEQRGLYFVTDGMANEVTPHVVVESLPPRIREEFGDDQRLTGGAAARLQTVLRELNEEIRNQRLDLWSRCIGATLVLALVRGKQALLAHLGDSRIYLHRGGRLEQVTHDHSHVQQMIDRGELTPAESYVARSRSGPTRFLGMPGDALADVRPLDLQPADRLLLCTDGLTDMLLEGDIETILNKASDCDAACQKLVAAANAAGGHDNITVVLIQAG